MYNGHCIIPQLSFFMRQSLCSKYLHMYNYQAALYKARHEWQYRCWASNQTCLHRLFEILLCSPIIRTIIHFPTPSSMGLKGNRTSSIKSNKIHRRFKRIGGLSWKIKGLGNGGGGYRQGNWSKNVARWRTKVYSATGLEGGTEVALPDFRS